ncbi:MAG: transcription antitermination factor NusB [Pirellulaceae bacterium]|nr:transcription antitermination factor NusB [Pirellulaceae bacterium]
MTARSRAREVAFQVLYQDDMNPRGNPAFGDLLIEERLGKGALAEFARGLVAGVRLNRGEVDALLERSADNWSLGRMSSTDRNVLRLGAYELLHGDAPPAVVIDEAIELAKRFGAAQSSQFVNGILDKVFRGNAECRNSNAE